MPFREPCLRFLLSKPTTRANTPLGCCAIGAGGSSPGSRGNPFVSWWGVPRGKTPRKRPRVYDQAVRQALRGLSHMFDFMCGKRLAVMIRTTLETLVSSGTDLEARSGAQASLRQPATIDRLLSKDRRSLGLRSRSHTKPGTLLKHQNPLGRFWREATTTCSGRLLRHH